MKWVWWWKARVAGLGLTRQRNQDLAMHSCLSDTCWPGVRNSWQYSTYQAHSGKELTFWSNDHSGGRADGQDVECWFSCTRPAWQRSVENYYYCTLHLLRMCHMSSGDSYLYISRWRARSCVCDEYLPGSTGRPHTALPGFLTTAHHLYASLS